MEKAGFFRGEELPIGRLLAQNALFWHTSWFPEENGWKSRPQSTFAASCVRLLQGDYSRETVFVRDPAAMARRWVGEGASCLHLVDLDGARDGRSANRDAIEAVVRADDVPCELGGGIRDDETIGQIVPHRVSGQNNTTLHLRVKRPMKKVTLRVGDGFEKKLPYARPSEMIWVTVPGYRAPA